MVSKTDQLRAMRELRMAKAHRPNPFEDAARGRDILPSSRGEALKGKQPLMAPRPAPPVPREAKLAFRKPLAKDAAKTLAATKPWEAEGLSRRTWYRRQKERQA